jgi:hypothetical protein
MFEALTLSWHRLGVASGLTRPGHSCLGFAGHALIAAAGAYMWFRGRITAFDPGLVAPIRSFAAISSTLVPRTEVSLLGVMCRREG